MMDISFTPFPTKAKCSQCDSRAVTFSCWRCHSILCDEHVEHKSSSIYAPLCEVKFSTDKTLPFCADCLEELDGIIAEQGRQLQWQQLKYVAVFLCAAPIVFSVSMYANSFQPVVLMVLLVFLFWLFKYLQKLATPIEPPPPHPPYPLQGVPGLKIVETKHIQLDLDENGEYFFNDTRPTGTIALTLTLAEQNEELLQAYLSRYGLEGVEDVVCYMGALFYNTREPVLLEEKYAPSLLTPEILAPYGVEAGAIPILMLDAPLQNFLPFEESPSWSYECAYEIQVDPGNRVMADERSSGAQGRTPVTIMPIMCMDDERVALVLELVIHDLASFTVISELTVKVPSVLGAMLNSYPLTPVCQPEMVEEDQGSFATGWTILSWPGGIDIKQNFMGKRRLRLYCLFEKDVREDMLLVGEMKLVAIGKPATPSGLKCVKYVSSTGGITTDLEEAQVFYELLIGFTLSLAKCAKRQLRYKPKFQDIPTQLEFKTKLSAFELVTALLRALSHAKFYFKLIEESQESNMTKGLDSGPRFWELTGRYYLNAFPVTVHLYLYSDAMLAASLVKQEQIFSINVSVVASVSTNEMRHAVDTVYCELWEVMLCCLSGLPVILSETQKAESLPSSQKSTV